MSNVNEDDDNVCFVRFVFVVDDDELVFQDQNNDGKHRRETCDVDAGSADSTPFLLLGRGEPIIDKASIGKLSKQTVVDVLGTSIFASNGNIHRRSYSLLPTQRSIRASIGPSPSGTLSFHNINYIIGETSKHSSRRKLYPSFMRPQSGKQILHDVSGVFTAGMNAIMGENPYFS